MIDLETLNDIIVYLIKHSRSINDYRGEIEVAGIDVKILAHRDNTIRLTFYTDRWGITVTIFDTIDSYRRGKILETVLYQRGEEAMLEDFTAIRLAISDGDIW
jgi:hypothetical protein